MNAEIKSVSAPYCPTCTRAARSTRMVPSGDGGWACPICPAQASSSTSTRLFNLDDRRRKPEEERYRHQVRALVDDDTMSGIREIVGDGSMSEWLRDLIVGEISRYRAMHGAGV